MYNNTPLTMEQFDFAAENHDLVSGFLDKNGYPESEYYDVAIFGYIAAVRAYLTREDIRQQYTFRALAYSRMRSSISTYIEAEKKRSSRTVSYDEYERYALCSPVAA